MTLNDKTYEDMILKATSFEQEHVVGFFDAFKLAIAPLATAMVICAVVFWPSHENINTSFDDELAEFNIANDYIVLDELSF